MVKRLSKSRRSAILEHLLALEKQIRQEFGGDADNTQRHPTESRTRHRTGGTRSSMRRDGFDSGEDRLLSNENAAGSMH